MGKRDRNSVSFPPLYLSQTCLQSRWGEFGNRVIQDLLPARSRAVRFKMGKNAKPPTFILFEKSGLSSKSGQCSMDGMVARPEEAGRRQTCRLLSRSDGRGWGDVRTLT